MDIARFISQFFYRIRYWLLWGTLIVASLVLYFTQFLPYKYTVNASLYAGITNATTLDGSTISGTMILGTFDNLINLAKSHGVLQKVSLRLLATSLTYGEEWNDNKYIQAVHYRRLLEITPPEVQHLVNKKNLDETIKALSKYRKENNRNFVYAIFNKPGTFYSAQTLESVIVKRAGVSDILNLTYTSEDPGITQQTLIILIDELRKAYELLHFQSIKDVIAYFEEQVRKAQLRLNKEEDQLMHYCMQEMVINYGEETEALSETRYEVDDRKEEILKQYESAKAIVDLLNNKMDIRADILRNNTNLLSELNRVSTLNQQILEEEIFISDKGKETNQKLNNKKAELKDVENNINHISDELNILGFSKEGVGIEEMVSEWLQALVNEAKYGAQLKVINERQQDIFDQYRHMAPVGTQVSRFERAIGVSEDNYKNQIYGLAQAYLRLKNTEITTSKLQDIALPEYPLQDNGRNRAMYVLVAIIASLAFITGYFLLIELLDRTLRDPVRSKLLTGLDVMAAFNGTNNLKFRGFLRASNRMAAAYACRRLNHYIHPDKPTIINLISMEPREGKSFLSKYFINYWEDQNLHVRLVQVNLDYQPDSPEYLKAQQLSDFWTPNEAEKPADIILVEYPAYNQENIPLRALKSADVTLLIANACRLWRSSDSINLKNIQNILKDSPLYLYLNNADREVVETFTGNLPPYTPLHSFMSRLSQLGLTSKHIAVK